MKKKLIVLAIMMAVIVGLLAYYQYVPFWASIVSTGSVYCRHSSRLECQGVE